MTHFYKLVDYKPDGEFKKVTKAGYYNATGQHSIRYMIPASEYEIEMFMRGENIELWREALTTPGYEASKWYSYQPRSEWGEFEKMMGTLKEVGQHKYERAYLDYVESPEIKKEKQGDYWICSFDLGVYEYKIFFTVKKLHEEDKTKLDMNWQLNVTGIYRLDGEKAHEINLDYNYRFSPNLLKIMKMRLTEHLNRQERMNNVS